ncbi:4Fe-4S dicluster domain-containing protein [Adlercreutzia equolifaciens]|uniref:4Fe-4S dicluster domain-containing protein n=1 Tax=Adlercreutzia equolifaciens TaxID=446660 RepID=UPI0023AE8960|nr:4Fe-4S dicluster domain-containing protein [Adlercreutzia equolifaciens]MDE8702679.1 4Fe-4S dicluster domain-containing protein [Adlercreutzia equolifaciens]
MSLGFYFDATKCTGCRTCQVACLERFDVAEMGVHPRRVTTYEFGSYPGPSIVHLSIGCNHCDSPACVEVCPTGALAKDAETGVVMQDTTVCIGCQSCVNACPYGAPQYVSAEGYTKKCDSCKTLRDAGMVPQCVTSCMNRALDFGELDALRAKYGDDLVQQMGAMPDAGVTSPNLLIKMMSVPAGEGRVIEDL